MRAGYRLGQLIEEWFLYFGELLGVHNLKDILNLVQKHDLFSGICLWPIPKQTEYNLNV